MRWFQRCKHERVRCIHGDEILRRVSWRGVIHRAACLDCGRALDRGLPEPCSVTGAPHSGLMRQVSMMREARAE